MIVISLLSVIVGRPVKGEAIVRPWMFDIFTIKFQCKEYLRFSYLEQVSSTLMKRGTKDPDAAFSCILEIA
jgi:hypothetical protein